MKVVYASAVCSKQRFSELFPDAENMPGQQVQKYHRLLLGGLAKNGTSVIALSGPPITRANHGATMVNIGDDTESGVAYRYLPTINLPGIKNLVTLVTSFANTYGVLRRDSGAVVVCDVLNFSVATGALLAAKVLRRSNTGIVTDIPKFLINRPGPLATFLTTYAMERYDSYVLLTQQMSSLVNRRRMPEVVIEGLVDIDMKYRTNELDGKHSKSVCLYAGTIDRRYGVETLVQGFLRSHVNNAELWIYGKGDYENNLKELALAYPRVKYFGMVPNDIVVEEQLRATVLVNPRSTWEEFTNYSYPSKNMEYMASGTPLLTTLLPGMPDEYLPYVYLLRDETPQGIARMLDALLAEDPIVLHSKGKEAKEYVVLHKSNTVQAGRLIQFIQEVAERSLVSE